jgi:uncharacterized repeat protein (TIGR02543 family)
MKKMIKHFTILTVGLLLAALILAGCVYNPNIDHIANETGDGSFADRTLVGIYIIKAPNKTKYWLYEPLNLDGIKVTAAFSDKTTEAVDKGDLTGGDFDSNLTGIKTVSVTYGGLSDTFPVTVTEGAFTVIFNKNGGNSEADPKTKTVEQPVRGVDSLPTPPAKDTFTFTGWNTRADGSGTVFDAESTVTGNFTVYAQWTIKTYTITFNSNGGSGIESQNIPYGEKAAKPAIDPVKKEYNSKLGGWYTDNTTFSNKWDFTNNAVNGDTELFAKWIPYELGDTGPGGGKIFYRIETGFLLQGTSETCYYLEAAPVNGDVSEWSSTTAINPTFAGIGYGKQNTQEIVKKLDKLGLLDWYAAQVCDNYTNNGFDDWFLPSKDELNQLYINRDYVGNLGTEVYWSSTQNIEPYCQSFVNGLQMTAVNLNSGKFVRAVRAF